MTESKCHWHAGPASSADEGAFSLGLCFSGRQARVLFLFRFFYITAPLLISKFRKITGSGTAEMAACNYLEKAQLGQQLLQSVLQEVHGLFASLESGVADANSVNAARDRLAQLWSNLSTSIKELDGFRDQRVGTESPTASPQGRRGEKKRKRGSPKGRKRGSPKGCKRGSPKGRSKGQGMNSAVVSGEFRDKLRGEVDRKNVALKGLIDRLRGLQSLLRVINAPNEHEHHCAFEKTSARAAEGNGTDTLA